MEAESHDDNDSSPSELPLFFGVAPGEGCGPQDSSTQPSQALAEGSTRRRERSPQRLVHIVPPPRLATPGDDDRDARLVPAPRSAPRGRGRGRPKKAPDTLRQPATALRGGSVANNVAIVPLAATLAPETQSSAMVSTLWLGEVVSEPCAKAQAVVPHGHADLRLPTSSSGFAAPLPDAQAIAAAVVACGGRASLDLDEDVCRVVQFTMGDEKPPIVSLEAMSLILGVDRKRIPSLYARIATAMHLMCATRQLRFEAALLKALPRCSLLHYVEAVQYDETELTTRMIGDPIRAQRRQPAGSVGLQGVVAGVGGVGVASSPAAFLSMRCVSASQAPQRVMQTQAETAWVLQLGEEYVTITFKAPCPLSVLERTSASCIMEQQVGISKASRASAAFRQATRAATTDGHAANIATEAAIPALRYGGAHPGLHLLCDVHCTALVYERALAPVDKEVSGAIHIAKALRTGSAMSRFRDCLRDEIDSRLVVLHGTPPRAAVEYKKKVLRLFVANGAKVATRRALLALWPNGEWRNAAVEFYVRPGGLESDADRSVILERLSDGLVVALASSQPLVYNRSKWTGADLAIDGLAVFECVHRLLSTTFARFCASYAAGARADCLLQLGQSLRHYTANGLNELADHNAGADDGVLCATAACLPDDNTLPTSVGASSTEGGPSAPDWVMINAKDRSAGMAFLQRRPLGQLVLIRLVMEPLRQYLTKQFSRASEEAQVLEKAKLASAVKAGHEYFPKLRVLEVAQGGDDVHFMEVLRWLFEDKELWSLIPPPDHTVSMRALAFRCASRMGCGFAKLLLSRHKRFPFAVFRLLAEPELAADFRQLSDCVLDPWTKKLRELWPNMEGPGFKQVLYSVASVLRVDISHIEARHASVRRFLVSGSVQTHSVAMPLLSAHWLFQQYRTTKARSARQAPPRGQHKTKDGPGGSKPHAVLGRKVKGIRFKRGGFGGAWRAWVRMTASFLPKGSIDLSAEAARYRVAKAAGSPEYLAAARLGGVATVCGRSTGRHGFGGKASRVAKAKESMLHRHLHALPASTLTDSGATALALVERSVAVSASASQSLAAMRARKRAEALHATEIKRQLMSDLEEYERGVGADTVRCIQKACPFLATFPLVAEPTVFGRHARLELPSQSDLEQAVAWANACARSSGLATRLEEQWKALHRTVTDPGKQPSSAAGASHRCHVIGQCICSEQGQAFEKRVGRFLNYIKFLIKARPGFRKDLSEGFLVVRLLGMSNQYEELFEATGGITETWLHVGLMYWSPFEPTFMRVAPVEDPAEVRPLEQRVYLRSANDFLLLRPALEQFRHCDTIAAKWYRLEDTPRPIATFCLGPVPALLLPGFASSQQFWPRRRTTRRGDNEAGPDAERHGEVDEEDDGAGEGGPTDELLPNPEGDEVVPEFVALLDPLLDMYEAPPEAPVFASEATTGGEASSSRPPETHSTTSVAASDPAPPAQPRAAAQRRRRRAPSLECTIMVDGGSITYYESNDNFEARCHAHFESRCTLTRAAAANRSTLATGARGGRPLGFLAAWLSVGHACADKKAHKERASVARIGAATGHDIRKACRRSLADVIGADILLQHERAPAAGEEEEPLVVS